METTLAYSSKMASSKSTTKLKLPLFLRLTQWGFPKLEAVAPSLAHRWFKRLFFSPLRFPIPAHEREILHSSSRFSLQVDQHEVKCYTWGNGPVILFVHGWAGRASQFKSFVQPFVEAGYKVISFDAPAHGFTKGSQTSIIDFKNVILELEKREGLIEGIVSHSLGGGASLFALSEGLNSKKLVTISTPTIAEEIMNEFASRLNASPKAIEYLKIQMPLHFNRPFDQFMGTHFVKLLPRPIDWLIIHDENDKEASIQNAEQLWQSYPSAQLMKTSGLGHVRILRDEHIINECLMFMKKN